MPELTERFPITLPVIAAYFFAFTTLYFIQLAGDATPILVQRAFVLLGMLGGGVLLLFLTSLAFSKGTQLLRPKTYRLRYTPRQAGAVIAGLALVSVWQLYINQITVQPFLSSVGPQTALTFKIDAGIAEESLFGAIAILFYLTGRKVLKMPFPHSTVLASLGAAVIFVYYHNTQQAYAANPNALLFVFGVRLIITPIVLYTRSIFSGIAIHVPWNMVS